MTQRGWTTRAAPAAAGLLAVGVVLAVVVPVGSAPSLALGSGDPGAVVRWGGPLLRLVADAAAAMTVGSLVSATWFTVPGPGGALSGPGGVLSGTGEALSGRGWAATRAAGGWALLWAAAAAGQTAFTLAAVSGGLGAVRGLLTGSPGQILAVLAAAEEPMAWLVTAVVALGVAAGARAVLRRPPALGLLGTAVVGLWPPVATGHASSQAGHDLGVPALWWHVPAAAVWLGTLAALAPAARRRGAGAGPPVAVAARYGRLATTCWVVVTASGVVVALGLVPGAAWVTTGYGRLTLAVLVLTAALGVLLARARRRALAASRWGALAGIEGVALAVAFGASAAVTALVPPALTGPTDTQQTMLGFDLAGPPTAARLLLDWRPDVVLGPLAVLAAVLYLRGVHRLGGGLRGRSDAGVAAWPVRRTLAWLAGCAVLLVASSSGLGRYAMAMVSMHLAAHMLVSMLVPVLLALGAPVGLARRAGALDPAGELPAAGASLVALARTTGLRWLRSPLPAAALFVAAPFVLYLGGVFDAAVRYRWAELLLDLVFLGIGLAFADATLGLDPDRRGGWPLWGRLGLLLAAMPFDAVLAALLVSTGRVVGDGAASSNMYSSLALPWTVHDLPGDQRLGAGLALGIAEVALVLAVAALLWRWDRRQRSGGDDGAAAVVAARRAAGDSARRAAGDSARRAAGDAGAGRAVGTAQTPGR